MSLFEPDQDLFNKTMRLQKLTSRGTTKIKEQNHHP